MTLVSALRFRLLFRDLAAASAFAAVALSGALPVVVLVFFGLALGASFFSYRPLDGRRGWSALVLSVAAAIVFGMVYLGALDLIIAAVSFAVLLTAQRLVSEASLGTERQVLLASLLLMAGGAALSGEVWYAACLAPYSFFACFNLGLATLDDAGPDDTSLKPLLWRLGLGSALAMAGALVFFFALPRLSWNLAARRSTPGVLGSVSGMSDRVRLGGDGSIKTNARVVMRAKLTPSPNGDWLDRYWVGRVFSSFDGNEWRGDGAARGPGATVLLQEPVENLIRQEIELLPAYGARTALALDSPVSFSNGVAVTLNGSSQTPLVDVRGEEVRFALEANSYRYIANSQSRPSTSDTEAVMAKAMLAVPSTLDPRVAALAKQIAAGEVRPKVLAQKLERWLKANLTYTLELPGKVDDPVAHFLFESRSGHCEDFASALALMLRTLNVPSRLVGGFYGAERVGNTYVVRAGSAHVWTQVYVPQEGWVGFDATPEQGRLAQATALWSRVLGLYEEVESAWRSRVVDYSFQDQLGFVRDVVTWRAKRAAAAQHTSTDFGSAKVFFAAFASLLVFFTIRYLMQKKGVAKHPATAFLSRLERTLAEKKALSGTSEHIEETVQRLALDQSPLAEPVSLAVRYYLETRFGSRPRDTAKEKALLTGIEVVAGAKTELSIQRESTTASTHRAPARAGPRPG